MRNIVVICLVVIAVLSPLIYTYTTDTPGLTELSLFAICKYTLIVAAITSVFVLLGNFFSKSRKKYLLLYEWNERDEGLAMTTAMRENNINILPLAIDYFSTEKEGLEIKLTEHLKHASGAIVIIGNGSVNSTYFNFLIKFLKGKKINTLYLKKSDEVTIPRIVPKNKILGTIDQIKDPQYMMNLNDKLQHYQFTT